MRYKYAYDNPDYARRLRKAVLNNDYGGFNNWLNGMNGILVKKPNRVDEARKRTNERRM